MTAPVVYAVDDDPSIQKAISRAIRSLGYEVLVFTTPKEFLAAYDSSRPGCLLLDFQLPGQNGLELQRELRAKGMRLPIVFISGHGSIPVSVDAMKAGAIDFLEKPVDVKVLNELVTSILAGEDRRMAARAADQELRQRFDALTEREREVFDLVVAGLLNKQVAGRLGITEKTVKVHRARAVRKLGANSLAELVRIAARLQPR